MPERKEWRFLPGTHPQLSLMDANGGLGDGAVEDGSPFSSVRCVDTDKVYFKTVDGVVQARQWAPYRAFYENLHGGIRSVANYYINGTWHMVIGTHTRLYASGVNITPLQTGSTAIANSIATTNGSDDIVVTAASHGMAVGDRVKLEGAADTGGILAASINKEHIIIAATAGTFTVDTDTNASSTVSGGGGAATVYYKQIAAGTLRSSGANYARVWSMDTFGAALVLTPGDQGGVYTWDGNMAAAPVLLSGAPAAVNWLCVSNNCIVTFGASGVINRVKTSDVNNAINWTAGSGSLAWEGDIQGATRLIGNAEARDVELAFTETQAYTMRFQGAGYADIWKIEPLMDSDGLIGPKAACSIEGTVYWMGQWDRYRFDGSSVEKLPGQTCHDLIFKNVYGPRLQYFVWPRPDFNQVWFFFGERDSVEEPCLVAIYDYVEEHDTLGHLAMTAAENPYRASALLALSSTADGTAAAATGKQYYHNSGTDYDDEEADFNKFRMETDWFSSTGGNSVTEVLRIWPNGARLGENDDLTVEILTSNRDSYVGIGTYTFSPASNFFGENSLLTDVMGMWRRYRVTIDSPEPDLRLIFTGWTEETQDGYSL